MKSLKTKMKAEEYGLQDVWIVAVAISGNNELAPTFYKFYAAKDLFTSLTGRYEVKRRTG
ncbi:hypothetical protein KCP74_11920 [Salmonella enterica subsp. enterica]|nr:hypothetical protein KCP74_11920 [Salmonella enterica subsp. enterica]